MRCLACLLLVGLIVAHAVAGPADDWVARARKALENHEAKAALDLAGKAVAADPKDPHAYLVRGVAHAALGHRREAVGDFDRVIALDPQAAAAYNQRGFEHFKLNQIAQSIADFDKYLELRPADTPHHWQRGISYYYAGRYDEGSKQFEGYQTVDSNDVENAVWRYLCMARSVGPAKARAAMLPIGRDARVPMMEVYALFLGKAKPDDVLAAARAGQPTADELAGRLFLAHLYLGLYDDSAGRPDRAAQHLRKAVEDYKGGGYMWEVARVHLERLRAGGKKK